VLPQHAQQRNKIVMWRKRWGNCSASPWTLRKTYDATAKIKLLKKYFQATRLFKNIFKTKLKGASIDVSIERILFQNLIKKVMDPKHLKPPSELIYYSLL
jgi:hypothetical protein